MKFKELKVNSKIIYYGKEYTVVSIEPPNVSIMRTGGDGEIINIDFIFLVTNSAFSINNKSGKVQKSDNFVNMSILSLLSDKKREKVSQRYEIIRPIIIWEKAGSSDKKANIEFCSFYRDYLSNTETVDTVTQEGLIERIAVKYGLSSRTVKRYLASYRKAESDSSGWGEEGLIPKSGKGYIFRKDNKKLEIHHPKKPDVVLDILDVRIEEQYLPIIKDVIENEYLNFKQISNKAVYDSVEVRCIKAGIEPPKEITIYKLLNRLDPQIKSRMRAGKKASEKYDDIERGYSNEEAQYPLHMVEIDHTELDLDVIDDKSGYVIGRPWITLGIDLFSRKVWCMYISFEPPSANRVRKALQHGVFFKRVKDKYGTVNEWEVFGIPTTIKLDNGPEFRSVEVRYMINEVLKSNVCYRPVSTPRYGATIERLFGTINSELIHRLDGTRKSNYLQLGDYSPEDKAILTLNDITEILTIYITDIYHYDEHVGLPLNANRPITRYIDGLKKVGYPDYVDEEDEEKFKMELLPQTLKPHTRDGVRLENVLYKLDSLSNLIGDRKTKYKVKYDVDDISKIYLLHPESNEYVEIPAFQPSGYELRGVSRFAYNKIREILKQEGKLKSDKIPGTKEVPKAKAILQENILKKYKSNRTIRQQAHRMGIELIPIKPESLKQTSNNMSFKELIEFAKLKEKQRISEEQ